MRIVIFILLCCCFPVFSFAESNYDQYFDKGKELGSAGNFEEAATYFEKATQENPGIIDPYLNIGVCYLKTEQFQKAIDAFNRVTTIFPNDWRGYYQLAFVYGYNGEVAKALQNYNRAKELGIEGEDFVGNLLAQYQPKEFTVEYQPIFDNLDKKVVITIKGNPSIDKVDLLDVIGQLEKMEITHNRSLFNEIKIEFIEYGNKDRTLAKEKWIVKSPEGEKAYWINYNFAPPSDFPYKTMINVSEEEQ